MKQILTLTIFLLALQVNAQVTEEWVARYKGPGNPGYNFPTAIDVDNQGNIYVAGYSRIGDHTSTNIEIATIKYNSDGLEQWIRRYGGLGSSRDEARAIAIDILGNVYVTGVSVDLLYWNITTIKYSPEGNELWVRKYNRTGSQNDVPTAIAVDGTGNVYVTGSCVSPGMNYDFVTLKYNSNGIQQWVQFYNGTGNGHDYSNAIAIDNQDNIYVTGRSAGVGNHIDYATIKYNSSGTELWVRRYSSGLGSGVALGANAIKVDKNDNVYITGGLRNNENNSDYVTLKYDTNGILKWFQIYNEGNSNDIGKFIAVDEYSNVYVAGNSGVSFATIKYDSTGAFQWVQTYSTNGTNNSLNKMVIDNLGNIYLTGGEYNLSNSESKFITIKYDFDGVQKWLQTYQHPSIFQDGSSMAMAIDEQQNIYITGYSIDNPDVDYATIKYSQTTPLVFTKPALNEKWMAGETDTIKWTGGQEGQFVQIEYSVDNGNTYEIIDIAVQADFGKFIWPIPDGILSTKVKIKLSDVANPENNVISDKFRIKPYILTRIENGDYYEYRKDRDQWGFQNVPDHMWPQEWYQQFDYRGIDPFTGSQYSQWQALSAFKYAPANFFADWVSFVNAFSVDACYNSTSFGLYDWAAVTLWKSYHSKWRGSCFGIATANALAFYKRDQFIAKYPDFPQITDPINLQANDAVRKVISELFNHQSGNPSDANDLASKNKTPNETLEEIRQMVRVDNSIVRTLSIGNNNGKGAHSIIAYGLEQDESNTNIYKIKVYDNNPNSEADIIVNTQANNNNGTWSYAEWPNWGGSKKLYLDVPAELHLSGTTFPRGQNTQSPFIIPENVVNINYPSESPIVIKDNQGNMTGLMNNIIYEDIPNSYARRIKNGSEVAPLGYSLDTDNYSVTLSEFEDSTVGTYFFTGNKSLVYGRSGAEQTQTDRLFFDGGLSAVNPDAQNKQVSLSTLINETVNQKLLSISSLDLVQNDSVKIFNPDSNTVKLISYGSAKNYEIEVNYLSENEASRFGNLNVQLDANTSHTFIPDWTNLTNSQLLVLVDIGNNGIIDDTLSLVNQVTGIDNDQSSLIAPDSYHLAQNYPNPFNPTTTVSYQIPVSGQVTLKVFDVLGNEVAVLVDEIREAGRYEVEFQSAVGNRQLASGIYYYRLQAGSFVETKKMMLIK